MLCMFVCQAEAAAADELSRETSATNRSVGYIRWGRDAGCEFLEQFNSTSTRRRHLENFASRPTLSHLRHHQETRRTLAETEDVWEPYLCPGTTTTLGSEITSQGYCTSDNRMVVSCTVRMFTHFSRSILSWSFTTWINCDLILLCTDMLISC